MQSLVADDPFFQPFRTTPPVKWPKPRNFIGFFSNRITLEPDSDGREVIAVLFVNFRDENIFDARYCEYTVLGYADEARQEFIHSADTDRCRSISGEWLSEGDVVRLGDIGFGEKVACDGRAVIRFTFKTDLISKGIRLLKSNLVKTYNGWDFVNDKNPDL